MVSPHFRDVHLTSTGFDVTEVSEAPVRLGGKRLRAEWDAAEGLQVVGNQFGDDAADLNASLRFLVSVNAPPRPPADARVRA